MEKRIFLASPHMGGSEIGYVHDAFDKNYIAPVGEYVDKFEESVRSFVKVDNAVALSCGTAAIHLALKLLDVKKDDIVFCSDLTFSASANPILYENAVPVFIDCNEKTYNMDTDALKKAFEKYNPKAVIVVNLYGQSADMDEIKKICDEKNVPIIEDAAESLGATYGDKFSGTIGKYGIFSFNGNKIITTSGGGMLISNENIDKAKFWATQSREKARHYEHKELGYNYRLSNISAAIGVGQMEVLQDRIDKKKYIYDKYKEAFKDIEDIQMMNVCEYGKPNYWLSVINVNGVDTNMIIDELEKENIEARPVWKPMHMQPLFSEYDYFTKEEESISKKLFDTGICLPSDTKMTDEEQYKIIQIVKSCF